MEDFKVKMLVIVLGIASIGFGIWLVYNGLKVWNRIMESKQWMKTKGKVIEARLARKVYRSSEGGHSVKFHLIKKYEYTANGKTYTSEQRLASENIHLIFFTPMNAKEKQLKKLLSFRKLKHEKNRDKAKEIMKTMKGETIDVFYNPHQVYDACLTTRMPSNVYLQFFMACMIFMAGCGLLYLFLNF